MHLSESILGVTFQLFRGPKERQSYHLCDGSMEEFIFYTLAQSNDFLFQLIRKNYRTFECLSSILNTKEFYEYLIIERECVEYFHKMPNELKTREICWFCIKKDIRLANYIPSHCVTKDLLMYLIAEDAAIWVFKNIPLDLITQELCDSVIRKSPSHFEYIPDQFKTPEMCWLAINYRSNALQFVP